MNPLKKFEMLEATRLTQEGRLKEAMGLLLGSFGPSKFEVTTPRSAPEYATTTLRLLPPPTGSDGARKSTRSVDGQTDRRTTQITQPFGALLDQMKQLGPAPGLEGLPGLVVRAPRPVPDGAGLKSEPMPMRPVAGPTSSSSRAATLNRRCPCW
jgi:hypothetical protein